MKSNEHSFQLGWNKAGSEYFLKCSCGSNWTIRSGTSIDLGMLRTFIREVVEEHRKPASSPEDRRCRHVKLEFRKKLGDHIVYCVLCDREWEKSK